MESYLQQTEDAIYGEDFRNSEGTSVGDLMDLESAAKYWWVQEFTNNDDAFVTSSSYLYKERDGKLYWGPLWDFDKAFYPDNGAIRITGLGGFPAARWPGSTISDSTTRNIRISCEKTGIN